MKRVFIIHGWGGSSQTDWLPWLKQELKSKGYEVFVPEMPDTDTPEITAWVSHLRQIVGTPDKNTYFIGHSVGAQTILRYCETLDSPVGGAVFVAGWFNLENLEEEGEEYVRIAKPWIETPMNIEKIKQILPKSTLIISDNDPYGAFKENKRKFKELNSKILVLENAGHISGGDGFTELPIVVTELENLMK